jgi:protoporphyrinogen oxidase
MSDKTALIIGAGPAGLTAALELLRRTDIKPIVLEGSQDIGGISKTVEFDGNRIDIGGHRFFSKSDRVMNWWRDILPMQGAAEGGIEISYQNKRHWVELPVDGPDPDQTDDVMLVRKRVSRILFRGEFFDYPLSLSMGTLNKLGLLATIRIGFGFLKAQLLPIKPENTLEDFIVNRFGRELYATFFRDYTEKVWGVPCHEISAEWGAQRIKGLSLTGIVKHAIASLWRKSSVDQKDTETSLIEHFLYPKFGPGHMWQQVVKQIEAKGGEVRFGCWVQGFHHDSGRVTSVDVAGKDGNQSLSGDYVFSTMAIRDLISGIQPPAPAEVAEVSDGLMYRDFITIGVLMKRTELGGGAGGAELAERVPDNWIYVQEPEVRVGRLQIFNNWSPYMVADPSTVWMGMEYFCDAGDDLWSKADDDLKAFAIKELDTINVARPDEILSAVVIRMPKTYPAYFGSYPRFDVIRRYLDQWDNFFPLGRNGMHRYNNQDHSMLTAMMAVDQIMAGKLDREASWSVNTEAEYHEEKQ